MKPQHSHVPSPLMHGVTDYQVTGGQGAAAEKAALAGLGEAHGPTTGQRSGQLALPVRG